MKKGGDDSRSFRNKDEDCLPEEALRASHRRLEAIRRAGAAAGATLALDKVLNEILASTLDATNASVGMIFLKDEDTGCLKWGASIGLSDEFVSSYRDRQIRPGEGLTGLIAQTGQPIYIARDSSLDARVARPVVGAEKLNSFIGVPVSIGDEIIAVMNILTRSPDELGEDCVPLAAAIGAHVGSAIRNARLFEERRRAENALKELEEKYFDLYDNAPDMFISVDAKTASVIECNRTMANALGYAKEEIVGRSVFDLYTPESADYAKNCLFPLFLNTGELECVELQMRRKDKSVLPVSVKVNAVRDSHGNILHSRSVIRDITERKRLEEQLVQSQKMEAVGRLAGGIAHDFNNLLTIISGYSELLLTQLDGKSRQHLEVTEISRAAERAASLTQQLLAFSRKQVLQPKVLDLNDVVIGMKGMLRRLIGEDIELRSLLDPGLGRVKADPGQIEQVIVNLVVNARDAMPGGGILTLETANVTPEGDFLRDHPSSVAGPHVCLTVRDTGTGMSDDVKSHLFEPFFTTKEMGKGTGLGLSTVYGIINQSGGHICIDSEPGKGTTVRICFPRVESQVDRLAATPATDMSGRETVLVVEDEDAVRKIIEDVLAGRGYRVLSAGDGEEGLRIFKSHDDSIDLLLTDVVMPFMGGRELAKRLESARPAIKVLFMSGYTSDAIDHHGVLDDGLSFLQKPFSPAELLRKVREALDRPS